MMLPTTDQHIATLLERAAATEAGIITYAGGDFLNAARLSYSQLRELAAQKAEALRCCPDFMPRRINLIHFHTQLESIIWFWASVLAGGVPCLSTPLANNNQARAAHFAHLYNLLLDPVVITTKDIKSREFSGNHLLQVVAVEDVENEVVGYFKPQSSNANGDMDDSTRSTGDVAALMLTSGSSGNAKAVCLTHGQIFAAMRGKLSVMPLPHGSALLNWIALDHVASLVEIHLCAMFVGLDQVHVPAADVIASPVLFLHLIAKHGVSRTFAPNFFLHKLANALASMPQDSLRDIDLSRLRYIASGGEPNRVDTCVRVHYHLSQLKAARNSIIIPGFGMTESCAGAIFNFNCPAADIRSDNEFTSLGTCMPGIEMRISTTHDGNGQEGALQIRGPVVFERYFNDPAATRDAFTSDNWFETGDLASIDENGNLSLLGRSKEQININGVKYLAIEIEAEIEQARIPGVTPSYVVCFAHRPPSSSTEEIMVVYQRSYDVGDTESRMKAMQSIIHTVVLFTGARPRILPVGPGRLDKSTLGKISRTKVRIAHEERQLQDEEDLNALEIQSYRAENFVEPRDDIERTLMCLLGDTFDSVDGMLSIDTCILAAGLTSVDLFRWKSAVQKAFDITDIPLATIITHTTIRSLASVIQQLRQATHHTSGGYNPVITLQRHGPETPLWLFHPGIGEVLVFLGLAQYFPDRPVYALRARGFNKGEKPFGSLTEVLATYYAAVRHHQPHGPYALGGYSYGSMLAFELAKILEANGETVQFLGSFNLPPHIKDRMRTLDWTAGVLHIAHFCGIITEKHSEELADELRTLTPSHQVSSVLKESDPVRCAELSLTPSSLLTWTEVAWSLQKIGWEYEPTGTVAHMDIFYCQPLKVVARTREEYREEKLSRWVDFAEGDVRFHEVGGEHYTMLGPEHVARFQRTLKDALAARGL
ncbi:non-ribosomal peptide synthetase [Aspergillus lucknowensis]|uniref:Polyketide synthase PksJ n=1 Tax=Aspergillus lucknowensis TaxID=176173 RepID=A0ABR4LKR4_9EURO